MVDLTTKLREAEEEASLLTLKLTCRVFNLQGSGDKRIQPLESFSYRETSKEVKEKTSLTEEDITQASKFRTTIEEVSTFPADGNGMLTAPIGGARGYLAGALRTAVTRKFGSKPGDKGYGMKASLLEGTFISPSNVPLAKNFSNPKDKPLGYFIAQAKLTTYFDVIKESEPFELLIQTESPLLTEEVMMQLLAFAQRLGMGPKRRGLLKIEEIEKL